MAQKVFSYIKFIIKNKTLFLIALSWAVTLSAFIYSPTESEAAKLEPNLKILSVGYDIPFMAEGSPEEPYATEYLQLVIIIKNDGSEKISLDELYTYMPTVTAESFVELEEPIYVPNGGYFVPTTGSYLGPNEQAQIWVTGYFAGSGYKRVTAKTSKQTKDISIHVLPSPGCMDMDGENKYVKSWAIGSTACVDQDACRSITRGEDRCDGDKLIEFICDEDRSGVKRSAIKSIDCQHGCKEGACIEGDYLTENFQMKVRPSPLSNEAAAQMALAKSTLRSLSTAAEMYATANDGKYPDRIEDLTEAVPPYLNRQYCDQTISGYEYICFFSKSGYDFFARQGKDERDLLPTYKMTTGGILTTTENVVMPVFGDSSPEKRFETGKNHSGPETKVQAAAEEQGSDGAREIQESPDETIEGKLEKAARQNLQSISDHYKELDNPDPVIRAAAAKGIGDYSRHSMFFGPRPDEKIMHRLTELIQDPDPLVSLESAYAYLSWYHLADEGTLSKAIVNLVNLLDHVDPYIRKTALEYCRQVTMVANYFEYKQMGESYIKALMDKVKVVKDNELAQSIRYFIGDLSARYRSKTALDYMFGRSFYHQEEFGNYPPYRLVLMLEAREYIPLLKERWEQAEWDEKRMIYMCLTGLGENIEVEFDPALPGTALFHFWKAVSQGDMTTANSLLDPERFNKEIRQEIIRDHQEVLKYIRLADLGLFPDKDYPESGGQFCNYSMEGYATEEFGNCFENIAWIRLWLPEGRVFDYYLKRKSDGTWMIHEITAKLSEILADWLNDREFFQSRGK